MTLHRNIRLLALHNFCTDFVLFAPVAIIYFQRITGSYALGMSIFSIAYVSSAIFELPTGILSDKIGRKKTVLFGSLFSVLCVVWYAIGISYGWLVIGALFQGASRAFFSGNNDALLHDSLTEINESHEYSTYLGKTSMMFQVALAGAALLGSIVANWSFALVMWLSVIPQLIALGIATQLREPANPHTMSTPMFIHLKDAARLFVTNPTLGLVNLADVMRLALGESGYFLRSAFIVSLWPIWAIGISSMVANIGAAISYYFSGPILKKYKEFPVLTFEIIYNRIVNFVALLFPSVVSPVLMSTSSWLFGVGSVALNGLMQKEFTDKQRATMGSINSLGGNIVFGICSFVLGMLSDRIGVTYALIVLNIALLSPLVMYHKLERLYTHSDTL